MKATTAAIALTAALLLGRLLIALAHFGAAMASTIGTFAR